MKALPAQEAKELLISKQDSDILFISFINQVINIPKPNKKNISPAMLIVSVVLIVFITLFIADY